MDACVETGEISGAMKSRRPAAWIRALLVAVCSLALGGCVYLRLLQLKNQLAQFDRYFEADTTVGLKLTLKEPVLLDKDFQEFFKWSPESRQKSGAAEKWHFRWLKHHVAADGNRAPYAVELDLIFVDGKLAKVIAPETFFAAFLPKQFVLMSLKAMGNAKIDQKKRSASVDAKESGTTARPSDRPTQAGLRALLGEPVETAGSAEAPEWRYRFDAATAHQRLGKGGIDVTFTFNPTTGRVLKMKGTTAGMSVAMDYSGDEDAGAKKDDVPAKSGDAR